VPEKQLVPVVVKSVAHGAAFAGSEEIIRKLARVSTLHELPLEDPSYVGHAGYPAGVIDIQVIYENEIDIPAERERLTKEIAKLEKNLASAERQLGNDAFLAKAPSNIVEGLKKQESENRQLLEKAKAALAALPQG